MIMKKSLKHFSVLLVAIYLQQGNSELIAVPRDTEVLVHNSTFFNCSIFTVNGQIHWYHYGVGENESTYVGGSKPNFDHYRREFRDIYSDGYYVTREYDLIIKEVLPEDAGRYVCQDVESGSESSAELIVLGHEPTCQYSAKGGGHIVTNETIDELHLSCWVSYSGNIPPVLELRMEVNDTKISDGLTVDNSGKTVTVNLRKSTDVELNNASFTCRVRGFHDVSSSCTTGSQRTSFDEKLEHRSGMLEQLWSSITSWQASSPFRSPYRTIPKRVIRNPRRGGIYAGGSGASRPIVVHSQSNYHYGNSGVGDDSFFDRALVGILPIAVLSIVIAIGCICALCADCMKREKMEIDRRRLEEIRKQKEHRVANDCEETNHHVTIPLDDLDQTSHLNSDRQRLEHIAKIHNQPTNHRKVIGDHVILTAEKISFHERVNKDYWLGDGQSYEYGVRRKYGALRYVANKGWGLGRGVDFRVVKEANDDSPYRAKVMPDIVEVHVHVYGRISEHTVHITVV